MSCDEDLCYSWESDLVVMLVGVRQGFLAPVLMTFQMALLCPVGCFTASLAPTHEMPVTPLPPIQAVKVVSRHGQISPGGGECEIDHVYLKEC